MSTTNNMFIAAVLAQDDIDFGEEFRKFTSEEQDAFIDFFADLMRLAMLQIKELPSEVKVQAFTQTVNFLPKDAIKELSALIINAKEE